MKLLDLLHSSITGLDRPLGSRRFRLPEFLDSWHMKIVRMSTFAPDAFIPPPQEIPLVLIYSFLLEAEPTPGP